MFFAKCFHQKTFIFLFKYLTSELIIDFKIGSFDLEKAIHKIKNYLKPETDLTEIFSNNLTDSFIKLDHFSSMGNILYNNIMV